jgi:transcriptional regulator with XRE-family HTH domain
MYITKEQLASRLNKTEVSIVTKSKNERADVGTTRLTHEDRVILGTMAEIMTCEDVAEMAGVSKQTVSNANRGLTSPAAGIDKQLKNDIEANKQGIKQDEKQRMDQIKDSLLTNLAAAIGHVGNNISGTDAVEASRVAVDMSKILDRVTSSQDGGGKNRTAIIINVPQMKKEESYQTITV